MRVFWLFALAIAASGQINVDKLRPGAALPSWSASDGPAHFDIHRDPSAPSRPNVFDRAAPGPAVYDRVVCRDGDVAVKFRISSTRPDHSAGLIFRYTDPRNYYLVSFSVDDKRIGVYHVLNGRQESVGQPVAHDLRADQWYVAKVVYRGSNIKVLFGNRRKLEVRDSVQPGGGKTGIWTRGATLASFDDFRIDQKS